MNLMSQEEIIKTWKGSIEEPLVSIICLAYNYERFLPQAIEGVLMQKTNFPFELLIGVNPGSDNTPEIARSYAERYPLIIKAVIREENIGAHRNFKDIRSRAKGKYIAHCDADDYWTDPAKLQKQFDILESNKSCAITFHEVEVHDLIYRQNYYFINEKNKKIYTLHDLCYKNFIPAPSIFYRNYSFDLPDEMEEIQASDWAYYMLLAEKGDIYYLPDCMAVYRKHPSGVWGSMDRQLMAIKSIESMIQIDELTHGRYSECISRGMVKRLELYRVDQDILETYKDKIKAKTYEICRYIISNKDGVTDYRNYQEQKAKQFNIMEISEGNTLKVPEDEKIKITFVANGPNHINGPNIWLQRILPELKKKGFAPEVIFMMFRLEPCQVVSNLQKEGFKCHLIPWEPYTELNIVNILRVLKSTPPDIFVPNLSVPAYYASRWIRSAGIPTVGIIHSDDNFHHEIIDYFVAGEPVWRLSGIVCVSKTLEKMVKAKTEEGIEICMAPCGVPFPAQKSKFPDNALHIIYAGRLIQRQKRIFDAIESLRNVVTKIPDTYATIYGPDLEGGKVIELIKNLNLGKKLRYGGIYNPKDLFSILPQYHIFVLLSEYEGMPISLMEAMACGLVPVCTKVKSGVSELIQHDLNGLLIENESDLITAIHRLRTEKGLWERLSEKARETIKEAYTIEICADRWSMFLRKLMKESEGRREISVPDPHSISLPAIKHTENGICREDNMRLPKSTSHESSAISFDEFLNPPNNFDFIDRYLIRKTIKEAITKYMFLLSGTLLDVGCGQMPYKEFLLKNNPNIKKYIGLDFAEGKYARLKKPDLTWDGHTIPLRDSTVDCVMATEVLEHCKDPLRILKEIRRVLIPGGVFLFTTPFTWPLHDTPGDYYRYTPFSLKELLLEAGFEDVEIKPLGGWHATLAQMIGLWIKRAPIPEETRRNMFRDLHPFYLQLLEAAKEENIQTESENTITPGWTGIAYTPPHRNNTDSIIPPHLSDESLKICLFRHEYFAYSQTFIEDHITYLGPNIKVIHGEILPMFDQNKECILNPAFFDAVRGLSTDRIHSVYTKFLADYLRKERLDVVLAEFGVVGAKVYKACLEAAVPYVVHFHGYDAHVQDIIKQYEQQYREMFQGASYLVVVSKVMQEKLISLGAPPEKVVLNPYGVSIRTEDTANPETAPPIFLAVGRFVEKKGPHLTIQAFKKVVSVVPEARLIMVGDGPLLEYCQNLSKNLGIEEHVIFAGVHNRKSVGKFMSHSRAFVQHSLTAPNGDSEGLPLAILEAGAKGLPVVSTKHAGIMDAVIDGEHGFLVDEGNWLEMAEAMIVLARNPKLAGLMGKKFRQRIAVMYSIDRSIAGLRKILAKAANRDETVHSRRNITIPQSRKQSGQKTASEKISEKEDRLSLEKELVFLTLRKDFKKIIAIAKGERNKTPLVEYLLGNAYLQEDLPEEALKCWERVIGYEEPFLQFVRPRFYQLKNHPDLVTGKNLLYGDEPRVHILILTMNRRYLLEKTFKCLGKTDYRNYKVFLLDNCSTDGTREILPYLKTFLPKHVDFVFDSLPTNIGRPGGHNWMLTYWDHSDAQFIAILDDDLIYFKPNWLKLFLNTFTLDKDIAAVGSKTLQKDGTIQDAFPIISDICNYTTVIWFTHRDEQDIGQYDFITNIPDYVTGCFSVFKKEIFDKVGLFDIRYSPSQCVDIDHSIRIRKAGYDIFYNGNISVVHAQLTHEERKKNKGAVANALANAYKLVNKFDKADWDDLINKRILREKTFWETYTTKKWR